MLADTLPNEQDFDEFLPECAGMLINESNSPYEYIHWYVEDQDPINPNYQSEFGPVPKSIMLLGNTQFVRSFISIIGKN